MSKPHLRKGLYGLWYAHPGGYHYWGPMATTGTGTTIQDAWQTMELRVKAAELRKVSGFFATVDWQWRTLATGSRKGQRVLCRKREDFEHGPYWQYLEGGTVRVLFADVEPIQSEPSRQQDSILETQPQLLADDSGLHIASVLTTDTALLQGCTQNPSQHPTDWDVSEALDWHEARRADASPTQPEGVHQHTAGSSVSLSERLVLLLRSQ